ncbi:helicase SNF [Paenibacillus mesophilus]|uniref:DEAD/DEAH box helicase n=1 Tax=Paenibacillus mesophilus TaxID=2582849 RepID=UPI00110ED231|nr:DEAD/DEAH box helicase [Paenibacillus mesophilus]TMV50058.1 helicase SNF [Paenibacillus mesophilus]
MSNRLTQRVIKLLCGETVYNEGAACYESGKVAVTHYDQDALFYEAVVRDNGSHKVFVEMDRNGDVAEADCTCPVYRETASYCKHIAALMIHTEFAHEDLHLANSIMGLFSDKPQRPSGTRSMFDTRAPLQAEFICRVYPYGNWKYMFGIEMKVGSKKTYVVPHLRLFLERIERGQAFAFSKHFTYVPELHRFREQDDAVIRQLIQVVRNENLYREASSGYSALANRMSGDRMIGIPPFSWESLLPALASAPSVQLEYSEGLFDGIRIADEPLPLHFEFDQAETDGYRLDVRGLDNIMVLESYEIVVSEGKLLKVPADRCNRLQELKQMLERSGRNRIHIPQEQMEPFMEKVVPGLMKLGTVRIAQSVSDRIVHIPLKAKLYLDRVKDRLLAALEFQYGDIVLNPLEGNGRRGGSERIIMRDGDKERRILELMERSSFAKTESGYFMEDEDDEYEFLYHIVPELEKLLQVYATSAVKARIYVKHSPPNITVDVDERTDWLEIRFDIEGIPESEIRKVLQTLEEKRNYYRLPNGALLPLESAEFQEIVRVMNELGIRTMEVKGTEFYLPVVRGVRMLDTERQWHAVKLGKSFRRLLEHMRNPDHLDFPVPDSLVPVLRDYQKYGFQWMKTMALYRFGGILADDMGLGKTVQSIAFIVSVLPEIRESGMPAVIVAPASLVYNWRNELDKFAPELRVVIADGDKTERSAAINHISQTDVLITSYPLLRRDIDLYAKHSFHTLFLDEAQMFKNYTTQTAQVVKRLNARQRFALTGTPVENTLGELWSIFDAVFPGLFPDRKAFNEMPRDVVAKRVRPFLLRRVKTDVLKELPEKIETTQASGLLPEQKKLYAAYLAKLRKEALKHLDEDTFHKNRIKILAGLTRLRQLCCHPALFVEGYAGSSAKFEQLLELVEECRNAGRRVLVFSQFTGMLGLISRELGRQEVPYFYLDGQTPASERVELCNRFNEGERDLFLISLKAGGTGLNLTGADTVILYDLWWNPAVEQQAMDRAHRIGQKNVVQVIRLITEGTVEDKMYELQQRKKNLIEEVIQPGGESLSSLTEQELRDILMIG